jgi:hypothetical protein
MEKEPTSPFNKAPTLLIGETIESMGLIDFSAYFVRFSGLGIFEAFFRPDWTLSIGWCLVEDVRYLSMM